MAKRWYKIFVKADQRDLKSCIAFQERRVAGGENKCKVDTGKNMKPGVSGYQGPHPLRGLSRGKGRERNWDIGLWRQ